MRLAYFILLLLFRTIPLSSELSELKLPDDIKDNVETKYFNGNSLWGYINGGADLYLEYGFNKLTVHQFKLNKEVIKIEIYEMLSNEAAFGIFSISRSKCLDTFLSTQFYCINQFHIQIAIGIYYISIINETGKDSTLKFCVKLAENFISQINDKGLRLNGILKNKLIRSNIKDLKLFKGELGLQNINTNLNSWVNLSDILYSYLMSLTYHNKLLEFGLFKFKNKSELKLFLDINRIKTNVIKLLNLENKSIKIYSKKISNLELILLTTESNIDLKKYYNTFFQKR